MHGMFASGKLVRIRRGFYVETDRWLAAKPWIRFAWTVAAASRAIPGLVLCRETSAVVQGIPVARTPAFVECVASNPSRSGKRRPTLSVMGQSPEARQVRSEGGFPLRYFLGPEPAPETHGEFHCTGPERTALDVAFNSWLGSSLVVADWIAGSFQKRGKLLRGQNLLHVPELAEAVQAHPHRAPQRRAELALSLANPLSESAGESYSRAVFQHLGFEQPELQHDFSDPDGFIGRSDFWWPGREGRRGVVGEFDGKAKYTDVELRKGVSPEETLYREKLREDRIRDLGFAFVRWGWTHLENPERLRRKLIGAGLRPSGRPWSKGAGMLLPSNPSLPPNPP